MRKFIVVITTISLLICLLPFNENKVFANSVEDGFIYGDNITGVVPEQYYSGGVTIFGDSNPSRKDLVIPATLGGKPVTTIWMDSFRNKQLTSIDMSNNVKLISYGAFQNNQLSSVTLSDQLEWIGYYAFSNNNLSSITIPSSVKEIGENAFIGNNLKTIMIFGSDTLLLLNSIPNGTKILGVIPSKAKDYADSNGFVFEEIGNKIIYDGNGQTSGGVSEDYTGKSTNTFIVKNQESLKKIGFTFMGWNTEQDGSGTDYSVGAVKTISGDLILYAKWKIEQYEVTFNTNGGSTLPSEMVDYNTKATEPSAPSKQGYTFDGWYKEPALTNRWDFTNDVVNQPTTLYAKWQAVKYEVTYNTNGGSTISSEMVDYNTKATEPTAPTKQGYTFDGWYKEAALTNRWDFTNDVVNQPMTLYAKWKIEQYEVTYNTNGGSTLSSELVDYNTKATEPSAPSKQGYTFDGWYKEAVLTNRWDFNIDTITENTTLYAKWAVKSSGGGSSPQNARVYFESNGGELLGNLSVAYNTKLSELPIPLKNGFTFGGWYKEADLINLWDLTTDRVTKDTKLYAKWIANTTPEPEESRPEQPSMTFNDISNHWAKEMIGVLAGQGIITGYPDGSFHPNEFIQRQHVALLFYRAFEFEPTRQAAAFLDVDPNHSYYEAIMTLQQAGIVDGSSGKFNPTAFLTRAQMAKFVALALKLEPGGASAFQDVPAAHWSYAYIAALAENGIVQGDSGKFRPDEPVTRAEIVAMLYRALKLK
ncbi:InlB B-repeat-containing protein [Paenibacillus sp. NPDC058071]|uniref:InlB B-repeat-containing protein n=1 Tax=Paenibacillus sp. NPDC058071 TaxID=3346326 RepID=UPI0036D83E69